MLKSEHLRFRGKGGGTLIPAFINAKNKELLERAATVVGLVEGCLGRTRRELDELTDQFRKGAGDQKLNRGLVEVMLERCEFEAPMDVPAGEIRAALFDGGARHFPLGVSPDDPQRTQVMSEVAARFGLRSQDVERSMFCDLKEEQVLERVEPTLPLELLQRYNVELAQGVLLHAAGLHVVLPRPEPKRLRQLFRFLKFFRLLFSVESVGDALTLKVDGPLSVLDQTKAYGVRLAMFLPALLLLEEFTAVADVRWKRRRYTVTLDQETGLVSHLRDVGAWVPEEMQQLIDRLRAACPPGMRLGETSQVLSLSGRDVYVPDLAFHRGSKTVLLEVVWPWRKLRWSSYYERFRESAPPNALLLISAKSVAKSAIDAARDPRLISFRVTPIADKVVEAAERLL